MRKMRINVKVVFVLVGILIALFIGMGTYFCVLGAFGAGFVGIGFGLVGLGCALPLADGILFREDGGEGVSGSSAKRKGRGGTEVPDPLMVLTGCGISRIRIPKSIAEEGRVSVCEHGIYLENLYPEPLFLSRGNMAGYQASQGAFHVKGLFAPIGEGTQEDVFYVVPRSPIQAKAFFGILDKWEVPKLDLMAEIAGENDKNDKKEKEEEDMEHE